MKFSWHYAANFPPLSHCFIVSNEEGSSRRRQMKNYIRVHILLKRYGIHDCHSITDLIYYKHKYMRLMIEVGSVRQTNKFGIAVTDWSTNWGWEGGRALGFFFINVMSTKKFWWLTSTRNWLNYAEWSEIIIVTADAQRKLSTCIIYSFEPIGKFSITK